MYDLSTVVYTANAAGSTPHKQAFPTLIADRRLLLVYPSNSMCSKTVCRKCGLYTWAGCGQHIDSALRGVPMTHRCPQWQQGGHNGEWKPSEEQATIAAEIKAKGGECQVC